MALAVGNVVAAFADALDPVSVIHLSALAHIASAKPYALPVDTRKIRLPADARAVARIQRVIPDIEFPGIRCIDGGYEIDQILGDTHDVFVGADAVERRNFIRGKLFPLDRQTPPGVCETGNRALLFGPAKNRDAPARPVFDALGARIILLV